MTELQNTVYKREWRQRPGVKGRTAAQRVVRKEREWTTSVARRRTPEGWAKWAVVRLRHRAKKCGLEFSVSWKDLLPPSHCPVLGMELILAPAARRGHALPASASVDRFDNGKGYVIGNVRVISNRANLLKKDATLEEIRSLARYMEGLQP